MPPATKDKPVINYVPGARVIIRDEEWLIRRVDKTDRNKDVLLAIGLSPLVSGQERYFLPHLENSVEIIDPRNTEFVHDESAGYQKSRLYLDSLLRQTPPTDEKLYIGHKAAIDPLPFQLDPALQALREPRQRILIADSVGLGKTIECGILLSELIKRGKGKRILVLAVKSMLTQFQKELWARFSIPLVRLDSTGIQRVRNRIPTNHNPFNYYDKAIISIDTLKQESEYRTYLENAYWDVIVIDEAQNVAQRTTYSQRSKLAKLLSSRSDALIMLSATPHDGRRESFASLMTMLNPTAIVDPENYGPDDIKGLFIRRFKKDVKAQIQGALPERVIKTIKTAAAPEEENAYDILTSIHFKSIDKRRSEGAMLFRTTLEKSLFSSPVACIETIKHRIQTLKSNAANNGDNAQSLLSDVAQLESLRQAVEQITPQANAKYQRLLKLLKPNGELKWNRKDSSDRVVIFTERRATLKFLKENLQRDLKLKAEEIETLYGEMADTDIQAIVEQFGNETSKIRLLICSDVASEGLNLHYFSHRLIHYDIPWSLMVFQQRNGRIDRYGQTRTPEIYYLQTTSQNEKILGDNRILELLTQKDKEVQDSIGDPSEFTHRYDSDSEERQTAQAMEDGLSDDAFSKLLSQEKDPLALLLSSLAPQITTQEKDCAAETVSFYPSDYWYAKDALLFLSSQQNIQWEFNDDAHRIVLTPTPSMRYRLKFLPPEILPEEEKQFTLTDSLDKINAEIRRCRESENAWPAVQLLWEQHPILEFLNDAIQAEFKRQEAPIIYGNGRFKAGEVLYLTSAVIPNLKSQPVIYRWYGLLYKNGVFQEIQPLKYWIDKYGINEPCPNPDGKPDAASFGTVLDDVVQRTQAEIDKAKEEWTRIMTPKLKEHKDELEKLLGRHHQLLLFNDDDNNIVKSKKENRRREIEKSIDEYKDWISQTMTIENSVPYIRIAAVFC